MPRVQPAGLMPDVQSGDLRSGAGPDSGLRWNHSLRSGETMTPNSTDALERLEAARIGAQIEVLAQRISERFPESGMRKVALKVREVAERTHARVEWVARPVWALRALSILLLVLIVAGIVAPAMTVQVQTEGTHFSDLVQAIEAAINDIDFIALPSSSS